MVGLSVRGGWGGFAASALLSDCLSLMMAVELTAICSMFDRKDWKRIVDRETTRLVIEMGK